MQGLSIQRGCKVAVALAGVLLTATAQGQWGGSISAESDDRYRGVSLSDSHPSVRLTANYDSPQRWYAGASLARAALTSSRSYTQSTGYGGWLAPAFDGHSVELGLSVSHFAGISGYDFGEGYVGVISDAWASRLYYSPDYYGRHVQVAYLEIDSHLPLANRARLFAHVGALVPLKGASRDADKGRFDGRVGWGIVLGPWDVHLAATAVTRQGPYPAVFSGRRNTIAAGASFAF